VKNEIFAGIFDLPETLDRGPPHYGSGLFVLWNSDPDPKENPHVQAQTGKPGFPNL
jgi:hypothetical protein